MELRYARSRVTHQSLDRPLRHARFVEPRRERSPGRVRGVRVPLVRVGHLYAAVESIVLDLSTAQVIALPMRRVAGDANPPETPSTEPPQAVGRTAVLTAGRGKPAVSRAATSRNDGAPGRTRISDQRLRRPRTAGLDAGAAEATHSSRIAGKPHENAVNRRALLPLVGVVRDLGDGTPGHSTIALGTLAGVTVGQQERSRLSLGSQLAARARHSVTSSERHCRVGSVGPLADIANDARGDRRQLLPPAKVIVAGRRAGDPTVADAICDRLV